MIYNLDRRSCLAEAPVTALGWWMRLRGMIGRRFAAGKLDAMVFFDCGCVHSIGMGIPLDLVFLDREFTVVALKRNYRPWSPPCGSRRASTVIELPVGVIDRTRTEIGDKINLNSTLTAEAVEKLNPCIMLNADILQRGAMRRCAAREQGGSLQ